MPALKRAGDAGRLLQDLVTRDPAFVRGGELAHDDIPVFTFHSLEPRSFERKMKYLRDSGYTTLAMQSYLDALLLGKSAPPKSVLITIDDGRASTWTVGYPILERLGLRATAFLVTSAVIDSDEVSKTIGDVEERDQAALAARDESADRPFITWGEARAMRSVIDVESHTHLHARIPVSNDPSGELTVAMKSGYGTFDCPFIWVDAKPTRGGDLPVGTPLPESAPRLSGRPAWRAIEGRFETETETRDAMRFDLQESRRLLRERVGSAATTLCYPWHVTSPAARFLAAEVGYVAAFAGKADSAPAITRPGSDPFLVARVGEDYLERLPGPGRRSLLSVLREKLRRK